MSKGEKENRAVKKQAPKPSTDIVETSEASRFGVYLVAILLFCVGFGVTFFATLPWISSGIPVVGALFVGALLASCIRVATQWERIIIMRFGRFNRIAGPGIYAVIPFVEYVAARVDQRMRILSFSAEAALTLDLVPVDIDAAIFWLVWDPKKACLEVEDYPKAVLW